MEEEIKKEETQEEKKEEQAVPEKPLDKMTVIELREFALNKNLGISGVHAMKKEELLPAVKEALGIKDEEPAKKGLEVKATVGEMKEKIFRLKEEKKTAISSKDKKKINVLRRRINRLKKRSKKVAKV
ncbi:MAG: transcription termination factor Rho [Deltaproteobacteria bacterium]|jgi:protein-arginine kinase activator protein McsA|nr:transcription termination factor Rho [Deltaproteobacteria bacterium]